jgi:glycosyltransferase involved in cell wall biosynthesis
LNPAAYDVVHAHSHLYFSTNVAAAHRWFSDTPLAITNHGLHSQSAPAWVFEAYLWTIGRLTFNSSDAILCYTDEERATLEGYGVTTPIEVVPNGIDGDRFQPTGQRDDRIVGSPSILFVGRLVTGKRPLVVVDAFERILEQYPDAHLTICGDGPLADAVMQSVADSGIDDAVTHLGHVDYDRMPAIYRGADCLVLPSRSEGFPRTVLEAMASDVPVVTSDLEQLRSVVDGAGEVTTTISPNAVATSIECVLDRRDAYDPRGVFEQHPFEWSRTVEETTAVLRGLVT